MFRTKVVENIKKHIFMFNNFFSAENHAVYEIMWKNIVEPGRPHMTRWRMRIACWTAKTETHSGYFLLFHCNSGCTNAPECYAIHTLPVLFLYMSW